jgi:hypothetical protein
VLAVAKEETGAVAVAVLVDTAVLCVVNQLVVVEL